MKIDGEVVFVLAVWALASVLVVVAVFGAAGRAIFG